MALTKISTDGVKDDAVTTDKLANAINTERTGKLGNIVEDTSPQLGGNLDTNGKNINFGDSSDGSSDDVLFFGAGNDLKIFHAPENSFIQENGSGNLKIQASDLILADVDGTEFFRGYNNGQVELSHNGSKKFETTNNGISVGSVTIDSGFNNIGLPDNGQARFGVGEDLRIYHDGTNSIIKNDTNTLVLRSDLFKLTNNADTETLILGNANGAVELYYDNVKKLNTNPGGIKVIGNIACDGDNQKLILGAGDDLQIYHDGNNSFIDAPGTGSLNLYGDDVGILNKAKSEWKAKFITNGEVQLYHDGNHTLSTASDGLQLQQNKVITRYPNSDEPLIKINNAQYAKALWIGGWNSSNSSGISRIRNSNDNLHIDCGSAGELYINAYASGQIHIRHVRPLDNDTFDLGSTAKKWDDIYATNGSIQTSDKTQKNTIADSDLGLSFINKLKPVSYKYNGKTRTHYGLIAQDVETVLSDISKATTDFAGFIKTDLPDEYYKEAEPHIPEGKKEGDLKSAAHTEYGLRYTEFISPLVKAVQELSAEVETLKTKVAALEAA